MATPRSLQIDLAVTPFYHCMSRCVRQSYICGIDKLTGKDYNHRKGWLVERMKLLANVFCLDICAYAVMSNHYHLVLHVNAPLARTLNSDQLLSRWERIFPADAKKIRTLQQTSEDAANVAVENIRESLTSISRFMACMNEYMAIHSNKEDNCKGRFWDGRFKSQALLDEGALLTAMAYVDLNPIRAGIAATPEESEYTSIYERIQHFVKNKKSEAPSDQPIGLMALDLDEENENAVAFNVKDYIELVDYTGRILRNDKRGAIPDSLAPILDRLNLKHDGWFNMVQGLQKNFFYAVGNIHSLKGFVPAYNKPLLKKASFVEACYRELSS